MQRRVPDMIYLEVPNVGHAPMLKDEAVIAAIEAFRQMGWERMYDDIAVIRRQAGKIDVAQKRDDLENLASSDSDIDKSSVDDPQRFLQRKLTVSMVAVDEPARLQSAIGDVDRDAERRARLRQQGRRLEGRQADRRQADASVV